MCRTKHVHAIGAVQTAEKVRRDDVSSGFARLKRRFSACTPPDPYVLTVVLPVVGGYYTNGGDRGTDRRESDNSTVITYYRHTATRVTINAHEIHEKVLKNDWYVTHLAKRTSRKSSKKYH